jgi:hypothetical protein
MNKPIFREPLSENALKCQLDGRQNVALAHQQVGLISNGDFVPSIRTENHSIALFDRQCNLFALVVDV